MVFPSRKCSCIIFMIKWNQCSASARMLINERHFKQHQLRQSVVPSHSPECLYLFFAELQKPRCLTRRSADLCSGYRAWIRAGFAAVAGPSLWSPRAGAALSLAPCSIGRFFLQSIWFLFVTERPSQQGGGCASAT